ITTSHLSQSHYFCSVTTGSRCIRNVFYQNIVSRMKKKKILIVEDQLIITMDLEYMLQELGYDVCGICTNYDDALSLIRTAKPDLISIDIILYGEKTGIDLAHAINGTYAPPFIFLTSHADRSTIEAAKSTNPAGYIVKPFTRNDV